MGGAHVLRRPRHRAIAQILGGVQWPVRVTQQLAGQQDQIGLTGTQDVLGLYRFGDHAHGTGGDTGLFAHALGELGLIARADRNLRIGRSTAGRNINQVDAHFLQALRQLHGFIRVPAVLHPVGRRKSHEQGQLPRPDLAHRRGDFQQQADTVLERTAIAILTLIG